MMRRKHKADALISKRWLSFLSNFFSPVIKVSSHHKQVATLPCGIVSFRMNELQGNLQQRRSQDLSNGEVRGEHGEREPITGIWGRSPQRGLGAEPLVRGSGAKPPEAKRFLAFQRSMESANLPYFLYVYCANAEHFSYGSIHRQ